MHSLWNKIYLRLMYTLKTLSRAWIELHDLPCRSVASVEATLLAPERDYLSLDADL